MRLTRNSRKRLSVTFLLWGLAFVVVSVASCSLYAAYRVRDALKYSGYFEEWEEDVDGETLADVSYGAAEWNKIDCFFPKELAKDKTHSAIVYIHGGAWSVGSRKDMAGFARRCVKSGYVAASVGYMLFNDATKDKYSMEAVLDEIDAALAKLKEVASARGVELKRVALGGDSAGGHILSLYAYSRGKKAPLQIAFIAPRVAPIDFHVDAWNPVQKAETVAGIVSLMTRQKTSTGEIENPTEEIEARIASVSPLAYLENGGVVPTLAAYGAKDSVVGRKHCAKISAAFEKLGAKSIDDVKPNDEQTPVFDCLEFPRSGHMLGSDPDFAARHWELFIRYARRFLDETDETNE